MTSYAKPCPTDQLSYNQLWLLSIARYGEARRLEGLCVPGRGNGRGLVTALRGLEKRRLVTVYRRRSTEYFLTLSGKRTADNWRCELRATHQGPWEAAYEHNTGKRAPRSILA